MTSVGTDILCVSYNPKFHCRVHMRPSLDSTFSQSNTVHTFTPSLRHTAARYLPTAYFSCLKEKVSQSVSTRITVINYCDARHQWFRTPDITYNGHTRRPRNYFFPDFPNSVLQNVSSPKLHKHTFSHTL